MLNFSKTQPDVVFHLVKQDVAFAVLEKYPYPFPLFKLQRLDMENGAEWRASIEYENGFTDNMLQRSDVLTFMVLAPGHIETETTQGMRTSVSKLLLHWAEVFPRGVPDTPL